MRAVIERHFRSGRRGSNSNAVQKDALRLPAAIFEQLVHDLLNRRHEDGKIVFRVPVEMQEDLVVHVG